MAVGVLDHLVIAGTTLEAGAAHVKTGLGLTPGPGGVHAKMGTHNQLLSLGPEDYLEVIATDPEAKTPPHPRWFDLDSFAGPPRLVGWAVRVNNLSEALSSTPENAGQPMAFERGSYRWQMAVPDNGKLPCDGFFPALIAWEGDMPAPALDDQGARLISLTLTHPEAGRLAWALGAVVDDDRVILRKGARPEMRAVIHTADGEKEIR